MKKLLRYLAAYKKESILGPLFKLLEASFELMVPLVVAAIIDVGIGSYDTSYVVNMCCIMIALALVGLACSVTAQYFAAKAAVGFATALRHTLFEHIQGLSYSNMDEAGTSTLITRMTSDVNQVQTGINLTLRLFLRSPFIVFGAAIMAFSIDTSAALVFAVVIPLLCIVVFGIMLLNIPLFRRVQAGLDRVLSITRENLAGIRVIRAFHKETEEVEEFRDRNEALTKIQLFAGRISAVMNPVTYMIINGGIVILIWYGAKWVNTGGLTQGQVVALVNYMSQILVELVKLASLIITITKAIACGNRIQNILDIQPDMKEKRDIEDKGRAGDIDKVKYKEYADSAKYVDKAEAISNTEGISDTGNRYKVEFRHVSFQYKHAAQEALTDIDFRVKPGETVGIIGGTGSGKTSLVNLIPRFYDITQGELLVDGIPAVDYTFVELREKIGVVPQKAVLFKGTIADNLRWGKEDADIEEMVKALEVSQALEFVEEKGRGNIEDGLSYGIEQNGRNLSGGQRQRLTIARALVKKPEILILDDSASALDYATDAKLRKAVRSMQNAPTVFVVSQRTSSIQFADKIVVLEDGHMAGLGTHEELLESCQVYQEIYYSQFPKKRQA